MHVLAGLLTEGKVYWQFIVMCERSCWLLLYQFLVIFNRDIGGVCINLWRWWCLY